jgi:acid phosphatase type 7
MIPSRFERGWLAQVLRASRSLLGGADKAQPLPREPYVQGITTSSAFICWVNERPDTGVVEYGKTLALGRKETDARVGRRPAVALTCLDPSSTYHYRVEGVGRTSSKGSFLTAPVGDDSRFSFAVVGDSGSGGKGQLAVVGLLGCLEPDQILHTGDVVYPAGEERDYDWRFFAPYRRIIGSVPVFPVLGNHDVRKGNGAAFLKNFHPSAARAAPSATTPSTGATPTSSLLTASCITAIRVQTQRSRRPSWSKTWPLHTNAGGSRFAQVTYGSSRHGGDQEVREELEPLLVKHGVDLVFGGHDRVCERTVPIRG